MDANLTALFEKWANEDIVSYLQGMGYQAKRMGAWTSFPCPFCGRSYGHFFVSPRNRASCFACNTSKSDDLVGLIAKMEGITNGEALRKLESNHAFEHKPAKLEPDKPIQVLDFTKEVLATKRYIEIGKPFFVGRRIGESFIEENVLSIDMIHARRKINMGMDSTEVEMPRYLIPHWLNGKVRAVNTRRDDVSIRNLMSINYYLFHTAKEYISIQNKVDYKDIQEKDLFDFMFGPKYVFWKGSTVRTFNTDLLVEFDGEKPIRKKWSYMILTESELDAAMLTASGYPAIAIKSNYGLDKLFYAVTVVHIISDRDEAGRKKAQSWRKLILEGKIKPKVYIHEPRDYKDIGEHAMANLPLMKSWLKERNMNPFVWK